MAHVRLAVVLVLVLTLLAPAWGFLCFSRSEDSEWTFVTACPSNSCFTIRASVLGFSKVSKGCADKLYDDFCPAVDLGGLAGAATCYCNTFLCNASSSLLPSTLFLLLPCILRQLL